MSEKVLFGVVGLAGGLVVAAAVWVLRPEPPPPVPLIPPEEFAALQETVRDQRSEIQRLQDENAQLTADVLNLKSAAASAATSTPAEPNQQTDPKSAKNPFAGAFGGGQNRSNIAYFAKAGIQFHMESELTKLKSRLRLTPEQEQQVRALMERQYGRGAEMVSKMFGEGVSEADMKDAQKAPVDFEAELKELLTPEQLAEYDAYKTEQRRNAVEMMAGAELLQMQQMLQLSDTQKDQVYNTLYALAEKQVDAKQKPPADGNWSEMWLRQMEDKKAALQNVLTPEQLELYSKQLENQQRMIEMFMPKAKSK